MTCQQRDDSISSTLMRSKRENETYRPSSSMSGGQSFLNSLNSASLRSPPNEAARLAAAAAAAAVPPALVGSGLAFDELLPSAEGARGGPVFIQLLKDVQACRRERQMEILVSPPLRPQRPKPFSSATKDRTHLARLAILVEELALGRLARMVPGLERNAGDGRRSCAGGGCVCVQDRSERKVDSCRRGGESHRNERSSEQLQARVHHVWFEGGRMLSEEDVRSGRLVRSGKCGANSQMHFCAGHYSRFRPRPLQASYLVSFTSQRPPAPKLTILC